MEIERRMITNDVTLRTNGDAEAQKITGYAALFYDGTPDTEYELWDNTIERIFPGAFTRAISEDDVRALFNHDPDNILGRTTAGTLSLAADGKGLAYEIAPPASDVGERVKTAIQRRDVTGSSFAFIVDEDNWRKVKDGDKTIKIREIVSVQLFDVGPVTYPAYESTTAGMRTGDIELARRSMDAWESEEQKKRAALDLIRIRGRAVEIINQQ